MFGVLVFFCFKFCAYSSHKYDEYTYIYKEYRKIFQYILRYFSPSCISYGRFLLHTDFKSHPCVGQQTRLQKYYYPLPVVFYIYISTAESTRYAADIDIDTVFNRVFFSSPIVLYKKKKKKGTRFKYVKYKTFRLKIYVDLTLLPRSRCSHGF